MRSLTLFANWMAARVHRPEESRCASDPPNGVRWPEMPYHVYTRSGAGAVGIIVETAREALAKAAEFLEDGHDVIFKDLLGNVIEHAAVAILAEREGEASWGSPNRLVC
jgi:hypothetical protein